MAIFHDLLAKGYLPAQLPPGFSSSTFASELSKFRRAWSSGKPPARSSFYRRTTALVNPIGFYFLAREIATYWPEIEGIVSRPQAEIPCDFLSFTNGRSSWGQLKFAKK
jgi:hypothetical protein